MLKRFGEKKVILLLDNCSSQKDNDSSNIPKNVILHFSPPNMTLLFQPADQGIISCLKVGYKLTMLKKLITICDDPENFLCLQIKAKN